MPTKPLDTPIKRQARLLMEEARRTDPSIIRFYWFPDDSGPLAPRRVAERCEQALGRRSQAIEQASRGHVGLMAAVPDR